MIEGNSVNTINSTVIILLFKILISIQYFAQCWDLIALIIFIVIARLLSRHRESVTDKTSDFCGILKLMFD